MTFGVYLFTVLAASLTCYMLGVSDGKAEGRIEQFQRDKR